MPFLHPDKSRVSKYKNPYESYPTSVIGKSSNSQIVQTNSVNRFIEEINGYLDYNKPLRLFFVGVFGSGKSFYLNLVGSQVKDRRGIFLPIKFHKQKFFPVNDQTENFKMVLTSIIQEIGNKLIEMEEISQKDFNDIVERYPLTDIDNSIIQLLKKATNSNRVLLAFDELEVLFASEGLNLRISDISSFLHSLSESFIERPNWGIGASITPDWYTQLKIEAPQIKRGRFDFKEIQPLKPSEIKFWIETKNYRAIGDEYNKFYPFEEQTVQFLSVVSGGNPRALEDLCYHLWSRAEPHYDLITEDVARKIFIIEFEPDAVRFFRSFKEDNSLSEEVEAFLLLLFLSGKNEISIAELCEEKLNNTDISISFLNTNSRSTLESRLRKAFAEIKSRIDSGDVLASHIAITGGKGRNPYRISLSSLTYSQIYEPSAE